MSGGSLTLNGGPCCDSNADANSDANTNGYTDTDDNTHTNPNADATAKCRSIQCVKLQRPGRLHHGYDYGESHR